MAPATLLGLLASNPAEQTANVYYSLPQKQQNYSICLSDVLGKDIFRVSLENVSGYISLPVEKLSGGIYFCSLYAGNILVETQKLVVK